MAEMKPHLWCRIWGHRLNEDAARYYGHYHCMRCWMDLNEISPWGWVTLHFAYLQSGIRRRWNNFRAWLTCDDCGLHFGKHDETQDHIPF